jgi:hypothetical protein
VKTFADKPPIDLLGGQIQLGARAPFGLWRHRFYTWCLSSGPATRAMAHGIEIAPMALPRQCLLTFFWNSLSNFVRMILSLAKGNYPGDT